MNKQLIGVCLAACLGSIPSPRAVGAAPAFNIVQPLTNRETRLTFTGSNGALYRIDASTTVTSWHGLVSFAAGSQPLQHIDSATPYLAQRFYRAEQLSPGTNILTGDYLTTTNGDVVIHPLFHASLVMSWNGKIIYSDPDDDSTFLSRYPALPPADLILVTHSHGDHYASTRLAALRGTNTVFVVPQDLYNQASFAPFRTNAAVLGYGASTNVVGLRIEAVAGYNANHAYGINNAYVLTIADKRILISGDTGNTAELRALQNVDVAFLCMNLPYTMSAGDATNLVWATRPRVVYPYHYRNSGGQLTNAATFKQWLGTNAGVEVRLRNWY